MPPYPGAACLKAGCLPGFLEIFHPLSPMRFCEVREQVRADLPDLALHCSHPLNRRCQERWQRRSQRDYPPIDVFRGSLLQEVIVDADVGAGKYALLGGKGGSPSVRCDLVLTSGEFLPRPMFTLRVTAAVQSAL
jgi:hypothetical protein